MVPQFVLMHLPLEVYPFIVVLSQELVVYFIHKQILPEYCPTFDYFHMLKNHLTSCHLGCNQVSHSDNPSNHHNLAVLLN